MNRGRVGRYDQVEQRHDCRRVAEVRETVPEMNKTGVIAQDFFIASAQVFLKAHKLESRHGKQRRKGR